MKGLSSAGPLTEYEAVREVLSVHCELLSNWSSDQSMRRVHGSCIKKQQRIVCRLQRRETVASIFGLEDLSSDAVIT
jgi:hypothetical protein